MRLQGMLGLEISEISMLRAKCTETRGSVRLAAQAPSVALGIKPYWAFDPN
jgi:hypothetical protein